MVGGERTHRASERVHALVRPSYGLRSRVRQAAQDVRSDPPIARSYPWHRLLDPLASLDMCTPRELAWVSRFMTGEYRGAGSVVELGAWLGAVTISLARPLAKGTARRPPDGRVHVYEQFTHDGQADRFAGSPLAASYAEGGSFREHFDRRLGRYDEHVLVHPGDVVDATWDPAERIELLFNDVCKSWTIWSAVRATFYRALVPGLSTVVEQDFAHAWSGWLHLWHFRARQCFTVVEHVPYSGSVVFRLDRPLGPELLRPDAYDDFSEAEIEDAFAWAESIVHPDRRANVAAARVVLAMRFEDPQTAANRFVRALLDSTPDRALFSELTTDVAPELARRLDELDRRGPGPTRR